MALPWLRFEPPSIRQARLRDTTRRLTGEVLELNELLSENLQRFREAEERPAFQPPTVEQTAIRKGQVFPDPALRGTDVGDRQRRIA